MIKGDKKKNESDKEKILINKTGYISCIESIIIYIYIIMCTKVDMIEGCKLIYIYIGT